MSTPRICQHCNGTTYCGASRNSAGKLKLRPACPTCIVTSKLDPNGIYDRVVCSVCRGTGLVQPETYKSRVAPFSNKLLILTSAISVGAVLFSGFILIAYIRERQNFENLPEKIWERSHFASSLSESEFRQRVTAGMTVDELQEAVGLPDNDMTLVSDPEALQVWDYTCSDSRLQVLVQDGRVHGIKH